MSAYTPASSPVSGDSNLQAVLAAIARTHDHSAQVRVQAGTGVLTGLSDLPSYRSNLSLQPAHGQPEDAEAVLLLPTEVYVQLPPGRLRAGRRWITADLKDSDSLKTTFPQLVLEVEALNPAFSLDTVAWGAQRTATPTADSIDGRPAQLYEVSVDLTQAIAASRGESQVPFGTALSAEVATMAGDPANAASAGGVYASGYPPEVSGPSEVVVEVWVTPDGRVGRIRSEVPGSGSGTVTVTLVPSDAEPEMTVPFQAEVVGIGSLAPTGERENNGGGDSDGG